MFDSFLSLRLFLCSRPSSRQRVPRYGLQASRRALQRDSRLVNPLGNRANNRANLLRNRLAFPRLSRPRNQLCNQAYSRPSSLVELLLFSPVVYQRYSRVHSLRANRVFNRHGNRLSDQVSNL